MIDRRPSNVLWRTFGHSGAKDFGCFAVRGGYPGRIDAEGGRTSAAVA
jgi:hypothetical protein